MFLSLLCFSLRSTLFFSLLSVLDSHLTLFLSSHKLLKASISNSSFRLEGLISLSSFTVLCHSPSFAASFTVDLVVWLVGSIFQSSFTALRRLPSFTANFIVDLVVWFVGSISLFDGDCVRCLGFVREMRMGKKWIFY